MAAIAVGLVGTSLLLGPTHGSLGLMGAMAANAGRDSSMRRRVRTLLVVGATTLGCQTLGLLIAPYPWLVPPVMTVLTLIVVWAWHALVTGPPGPINTVFAGAFGTYMGTHGWTVTTLVPITALAWLLASLTSVAILAADPHGLDREAVDAADGAVATYRDLPDDTPASHRAAARTRAWVAVDEAWYALRTDRTPGTVPLTASGRDLEERLRGIHLNLVASLHAESFPTDHLDIAEHFDLVPLGRPDVGYLLRTGAQRGSRARLVAGRAAVAVLLAASTMFVSPVGHPYWAILSALIVLHMGASRMGLTIRALHRVVGTGVGVGVYLLIVLAQPGQWARIGIVIVSILALEALVRRNYAVAVVFVTVFALMMTPITSPGEITALMRDRFVETVIGAGAAVLVTWLVGRRAPVLLVRRQYRLTLASMMLVLQDLAAGRDDGVGPDRTARTAQTARGGHDGAATPHHQARPGAPRHLGPDELAVRARRRNLVFELGRAGAILAAQRPDDPAALAPWEDLQREVSLLGFDVVAAAWRDPGAGAAAARDAHRGLAALVAALPPISSVNIDPRAVSRQVASLHADYLAAA